MLLVLRADAAPTRGAGHVVRCLAVAEAARARGHEVLLVAQVRGVPWLSALLAEAGIPLEAPPPWPRLASWTAAAGAEALHVDDYDAPADLLPAADAASLLLSNVQDGSWGRRPAHIAVDPTPGAVAGPGLRLAGARYAMLRSAIRRARHERTRPAGHWEGKPLVAIVTGGTDAAGSLHRALSVLEDVRAQVPVDVEAALPVGWQGSPPWVKPLPKDSRLAGRLAAADLVVTPAGTTAAEVCCVGSLPATWASVPNQRHVQQALVDAGVCLDLSQDEGGMAGSAADALTTAVRRPALLASLARRASGLVDGLGATRLVRALEEAAGPPAGAPPLRARRAMPSDASLLLAWRNDPGTIAGARSQMPVGPDRHEAWLESVLTDDARLLLIVEDFASAAVATVRWDPRPRETDARDDAQAFEVSITVGSEDRGRGWGGAVLAAGERALLDAAPGPLRAIAAVRLDNVPSEQLFERAGYGRVGSEGGFVLLERRLR